MDHPEAPYFDDVAAGPPGGHAVWATGADGVRVRIGLWPRDGTAGTVVMFPGRTEYVEKYSDAAAALHDRGFASAAIDWRGQGLTERPRANRMSGHVGDFVEYQTDVDAYLAALDAAGFPRPFHLLAHSMGGLIGLRSAMRSDLPVLGRPGFATVVFSAPMWGLPLPPARRLAARVMSGLGGRLGWGERATPGSGASAEPAAAPFEANLLTTDPEMFAWMKRQIAAHPDLALGAPSLGWLGAALIEMLALSRAPAPGMPCLALLGDQERIVDPADIRARMARWPGGRLEMVPDARHEVLMEDAATRARLFDLMADHFRDGTGSTR